MTHLKKYWYWYLIAIVVLVAAILAYSNWETVKGWFSSSTTPGAGGRITNNRIPVTQKTDCIGGYESIWGVVGSNARKCKNNADGTYTYV